MNPSFEVPAQYFYALAAGLPIDVSAEVRYRLACQTEEKVILDQLRRAVDAGVITEDPNVTVEMAARRLRAFGTANGAIPVCKPGVGTALVEGYAKYHSSPPDDDPAKDIAPFWDSVMADPVLAKAHLELALCAVTQEPDPQPVISAVADHHLPLDSVKNLDPNVWPAPHVRGLDLGDWLTVFKDHEDALPTITKPGTVEERVRAFVRRLRRFFDVAVAGVSAPGPDRETVPMLVRAVFEPLVGFFGAYVAQPGQAGFAWGNPFDPGALVAAVDSVAMDTAGKAWLAQAVQAINQLYTITGIGGATGASDPLRFSYTEALYARGFTSAAEVAALSQADFAAALIGTPAHPQANAIWTKAGGQAVAAPGPTTPQPINPGTLTDCVPFPELSPLGATAYLHDLLEVSTEATCDQPAPSGTAQTVGALVSARRGKVGDLSVTEANAETPLPVIDLVNECLESMVATGQAHGVVYDTAGDKLGDHVLRDIDEPADEYTQPFAHDPATLFGALPEHSSPATPVAAPKAYTILAADFSAPDLPYSQPLDINRSYLGAMGASRFAVMRCFRKDISEFVLDPNNEPGDFPRYRWRYPVRVDIAREYLLISKDEYERLFTKTPTKALLAQLYGFVDTDADWQTTVRRLSEFLRRTGLSYCEFLDLWRSRFVAFHAERPGAPDGQSSLPDCEPCCPDDVMIVFDNPAAPATALTRLAVFIRLWRKLRDVPGARYTFTELADICEVLNLFGQANKVNPDFVRQLAAFQMLRDDFRLPLADPSEPSAGTGAARTHLLALWAPATPSLQAKWDWAVDQLITHVEHRARTLHDRTPRGPEFRKLLTENLDPLSRLAGFDPAVPDNTWHAVPTHTLRFAEQLSKIYTSHFGVGEIQYLYTADEHLAGDDPFPLSDASEARWDPLAEPDDEHRFSLWRLRHKLLEEGLSDEDVEYWTWPRIVEALQQRLGFPPPSGTDSLEEFGAHFFPDVLERHGYPVGAVDRFYTVSLTGSSAAMWNTPESPFEYHNDELRTQIPLRDEAVLTKLSRIRPLTDAESLAVRNLYYSPRVDLAELGFLFPTPDDADRNLVQEPDQECRWAYFRHAFALFYARCRVVARHLAEHVEQATGHHSRHVEDAAWRILMDLLADENLAAPPPWEHDDGKRPSAAWGPQPVGGAFAALVGLIGTGLLGEYTVQGAQGPVWRELRGPLDAFGEVRNDWNVPAPTIVPALDFDLSDEQKRWAGVRNGIAIAASNAERLGGAQGYQVRWSGLLLVEHSGNYRFWAGPSASDDDSDDEGPDAACLAGRRFRVTMRRGQKEWLLLSHDWTGTVDCHSSAALALRRGVYELTVEFVRRPPSDDDLEDIRPQHTGFRLTYSGPDTHEHRVTVPREHLYLERKDGPLIAGINERDRSGVPGVVLNQLYTSTLRDVRRTYQRAFKALLFAHRFGLSAEPFADYGQSELGFLLDHPDRFAGLSYYDGPAWKSHHAYLDFNLLPLKDEYLPPERAQDDRVDPTPQREQALFDIWERIFDYTVLRAEARRAPAHPVWLLFDEAAENQPDNPAQLLRHLDVDLGHADLVTRYATGYEVTADDLVDERWTVRVWHADRCVRRMAARFLFLDVRNARPDLWAELDPDVAGPGNENLTATVQDGYLENGPPRRYDDLKRLNDGLRERARHALVAYLCGLNRVPLPGPGGGFVTSPAQLSELLLLDVPAGCCERASRIEEGVTAVQTFVQRARLGLELPWRTAPEFIALWDARYATLRCWQGGVRRVLYRENWIEWDELENAERTEAFRFLEDQLRRTTLSTPIPGGLEYWTGGQPPTHAGLVLLQQRDDSTLRRLVPAREGLDLIGTPHAAAQRSWLAPVGGSQAAGGGDGGRGGGDGGGPVITIASVPTLSSAPPTFPGGKHPLWLETAIRLGVRFLRVPAAGLPPACTPFQPRPGAAADESCQACGCGCGCECEAVPDEYYFWLLDTRRYDQVDQLAELPGWHDAGTQPKLLDWPAKPMVHLMWCAVRNGQLGQPRRSVEGVRLGDNVAPASADLEFLGRTVDSLLFKVVGGEAPTGISAPPEPGFRYDLATDEAVVVPQSVPDKMPTATEADLVGNLPAYPYFAYFTPGVPLFPLSPFSEVSVVARALRTHCRFEDALRWYSVAYDPLTGDNQWCLEARVPVPSPPAPPPPPPPPPIGEPVVGEPIVVGDPPDPVDESEAALDDPPTPAGHDGLCCSHTGATPDVARQRSITLTYLEALLDWGDCLMRENTPEAFGQARVVFDTAARITGPAPVVIKLHQPPPAGMTVATFKPAQAPLNPRLISLYERISDRLSLIHECIGTQRLHTGKPRRDMPYFGDDPDRDGRGLASGSQRCGCQRPSCCCPHSPYRFAYLVQRTAEFVNEMCALGAVLQAAYEKGDAEYLAAIHAGHEHQAASLSLAIRQQQWREADWQAQALRISKESAQASRRYHALLVANGLIGSELDAQDLTNSGIGAITAETIMEAVAAVLGVIPDMFVGETSFTQLPLGTKLANVFQAIGRISGEVSQSLTTTSGLRLTQAGWSRRDDEWRHQIDLFDLEIEHTERMILAAERHADAQLHELEVTQRQIENARETLDILRDKVTSHQLFLWLQGETAALYYRTYELARCMALQLEQAFNIERGYTDRHFVPTEAWQDLRHGLLAGERLRLAVREMEAAYLTENVREYELTKHISLRLCFAEAFLALKLTGECVVDLPEWLFDLDYPGHYMRRVKSVSLTLPSVVGPYTGIHCRLTLLSSSTRVDPRLTGPQGQCCPEPAPAPPPPTMCSCRPAPAYEPAPTLPDADADGYAAEADDPRIMRRYGATEAIATSSGQTDSGLFELNFRDERYLPFEFAGAVSRWRIELPPDNNFFDPDTLSDVVFHLNYAAREGGEALRRAAGAVAQAHVPDDGRRLFDLRRDMPAEWHRLIAEDECQRFTLRLGRDRFPYLIGDRAVYVRRLDLFVEAPSARPSTHREVQFSVAHRPGCPHAEEDEYEFQIVGGSRWAGFYHGGVNVAVGPILSDEECDIGTFTFEQRIEDVSRAFLVVHYDVRRVHRRR